MLPRMHVQIRDGDLFCMERMKGDKANGRQKERDKGEMFFL